MTRQINILGIDPSISNTGYAIATIDLEPIRISAIREIGLIETKAGQEGKKVRKSSEDVVRARTIAEKIRGVIEQNHIKVAVAEVPSGAQSARAALSNGVCIGMLASLPVPLFEVSPTEVKLASHGTKTADKEDIVRWAVELAGDNQAWPIGPRNDWEIPYRGKFVVKKAEHPADACAAIAAGILTPEFKKLAAMILSWS